MHRLLRPKNINRIVVFMALIAPILYLFGTQFMALAGAHGEELFAEPVYVDGEIESDSFNANTNKIVLDSVDKKTDWLTFVFGASVIPNFNLSFNGSSGRLTYGTWSSSNKTLLFTIGSTDSFLASWTPSGGIGIRDNSPTWSFSSSNNSVLSRVTYGYDGFTCYESGLVPSYTVPENAGAYTSYLFGNMFGKSNFLSEWGADALSGERHGFYPIGEFFSYIDGYAFHLGETNIGLMGYGYAYYAAHVLLFDLLVYFATFFVRFIKDVVDRLEVSR